MNGRKETPNTLFTLFGATGDLAHRLIVPALFNLYLNGQWPERFRLITVDRKDHGVQDLAEGYRKAVAEHSRKGEPPDRQWQEFASLIRHIQMDIGDEQGYAHLSEELRGHEQEWGAGADRVFYMALPPSLFGTVAEGLGRGGLAEPRERSRVVLEKPLGHDLDSFRQIDGALHEFFTEPQIYRIDHFLGKETVQNILAMRFANPIYEPIWNRRYVDHVAITVAETLGVEHRAGYYEHAGALRDMVQNHLLQLLCLVAMEAPVSYDADDIRGKKLDVLRAIRPITTDTVSQFAARGQYAGGWIEGTKFPAYRDEAGVDGHSNTETYAALKLYVDNWRWQGVPFYMRTGKRLAADVSEVSIRFRDVPHRAFPNAAGLNEQPARLVVQIQPEQGIVVKFMAKEPGFTLRLRPVDMRFSYQDAFDCDTPDAYETLLWDIMIGDATLFMRSDQVDAAWGLLTPILEVWGEDAAPDFPNYAAGSWGPEAAELLVAQEGNGWLTPTLKDKGR